MGKTRKNTFLNGNDTIDPYPLIPAEATKILCITDETFKNIKKAYQSFCRSFKSQSPKRLLNSNPIKIKLLKQKQPSLKKKTFLNYEPSKAIYVNECDYRRWCRVSEWFNQYGPDSEY